MVLFVVDAAVGATDVDEAAVRMLRRGGKPVLLVANKVDDQRMEAEAARLWSLGLGEPYPVSALHGRGSGDLLDAVFDALPAPAPLDADRPTNLDLVRDRGGEVENDLVVRGRGAPDTERVGVERSR